MVNVATRQGTLNRTRRGYEQDLELVMGNDPIRAIVELVTNADDAYSAMPAGLKRKIRIEIERRRQTAGIICVKDRGYSMSQAEAIQRLGEEGGRTSGFESGEERRGLLGRGAKDIVHFGAVEWELKSRGGEHSKFWLEYDQGPTQKWTSQPIGKSEPRDCGTTVTLEIQQRFQMRTHETLARLLTRHFSLRPILLDRQNREVTLVDKGQLSRQQHLVYEPPTGKVIAENEKVAIPGYPDQFATINLVETEQSLDDGEPIEFWRHSLVIISGRTAYDVFVGKFRREPWQSYLGKLCGEVNVPFINQLIREFDDKRENEEDPGMENPISLLKRDRSGLVDKSHHPFMKALTQAIEEFLQPHLERIRKESEAGSVSVNDDTKKRNRNLGSLLGRLIQEEELDIEGGAGVGGNLPPIGLSVIPTTVNVEPGRAATVTIRFKPSPDHSDVKLPPTVDVTISEENGLARDSSLELVERNGYYSRSFSVDARDEGDLSEVSIILPGQEVSCMIQWQRKFTPSVEFLTFENQRYALKEGVDRIVRLLAPWHLISENDPTPEVSLSGDSSISIVQRPGLIGFDENRDCAVCAVVVKGRGVGSSGRLLARLGNAEAETNLGVTASGAKDLRVRYEELDIDQRAMMSEDGSTLTINARSPSIARYLGSRSQGYPGQDDIHFRTMLAEVVTGAVAKHVIQNRQHQERPDTYRILYQHSQLIEKWLPRVHGVLVPSNELNLSRNIATAKNVTRQGNLL